MNEYIQFEDVLASPVTGIQGVARESRSEEAGRRGSGKHRLATSSHRRSRAVRPFRGIAVVVSTAALAVAAFAVTSHGAAPSPARAQATISTTLNSTSPVAVAAKYGESLDPSMKLSTDRAGQAHNRTSCAGEKCWSRSPPAASGYEQQHAGHSWMSHTGTTLTGSGIGMSL